MEDLEFVDGLIVKAPHERAPDFVKASISIKVAELKEWLDGRDTEWVNVDVKESRGGKWYAAVNTFKPKDKPKIGSRTTRADDEDMPF